jgi:hypothetical protein
MRQETDTTCRCLSCSISTFPRSAVWKFSRRFARMNAPCICPSFFLVPPERKGIGWAHTNTSQTAISSSLLIMINSYWQRGSLVFTGQSRMRLRLSCRLTVTIPRSRLSSAPPTRSDRGWRKRLGQNDRGNALLLKKSALCRRLLALAKVTQTYSDQAKALLQAQMDALPQCQRDGGQFCTR